MEIKELEKRLELEYHIGPIVLEGETECRYETADGEASHMRKLQAVASIDVVVKFSKQEIDDEESCHDAFVSVTSYDIKDTSITRMGEGRDRELYCSDHEKIVRPLEGRLKESIPGYDSRTSILMTSEDLFFLTRASHHATLVKPYIAEIAERIVADAKKTLDC